MEMRAYPKMHSVFFSEMSIEDIPKRSNESIREYTLCLEDFFNSPADACRLKMSMFPSKNLKTITAGLSFRIRTIPKFYGIHPVQRKGIIYLVKRKFNGRQEKDISP